MQASAANQLMKASVAALMERPVADADRGRSQLIEGSVLAARDVRNFMSTSEGREKRGLH